MQLRCFLYGNFQAISVPYLKCRLKSIEMLKSRTSGEVVVFVLATVAVTKANIRQNDNL